jgi:hypothetical protein
MNKKLGDCRNNVCQKGGVKIHETVNSANDKDQLEFFNRIKAQNKHTGVRINQSENEYSEDPFSGLSPFKNKDETKYIPTNYDTKSYDKMDLNIDSYSREDLFKLFGLKNISLSEEIIKECKKTVLKTHPDRSKLDEKYFIFFSNAYKKLLSIYEFQNKTNSKKSTDTNEYFDSENVEILDNFLNKQKKIKDPKNFNQWFNEKFDQYKVEDEGDGKIGYGNWLKSDEGIIDTSNVAKADMANEFERHKKQIQSMTVYRGVNDAFSSTFGTSIVSQQNNYTSGGLFNDGLGYTDLKQAYEESVIPITEDDYNNIPKYRNVNDYKNARDNLNTTPLTKEDAMKQLFQQQKREEDESVALAFQLAKQNEKAIEKNKSFWGELKQLTGW